MKFVHIADIHLGTGFTTASFGSLKGSERRKEIKETLMRVVTYCETSKVDLLLIAGDMFEEASVTLSELKDINGGFAQLTKTKVLICAGNHDPIIDSKSPYNLLDWCHQVTIFDTSLHSMYFDELNTEVHSFSWHQKHLPALAIEEGYALKENSHQLLMLHGDAYQNNDYLYIDAEHLKSYGFDYVALGHIHKKDFIEPWMAYPGSLEPLDFSETGDHGFIVGEVTGDGLTLDFVPFAKRAFHQVNVILSADLTYELIFEKVKNSLSTMESHDFYRVILSGDIDPDVMIDEEDLIHRLGAFYYYVEIKDETQLDIDIEQLEKEYCGTLIGLYIERMKALGIENPIVAEALKKGLRLMLEEQVQ